MAHPETVEILERLVGFPTVSGESNLDLIGWVGSFLGEHGIDFWLERPREMNRASLFALVGPRAAGGVVLSGHSDVVPVTGQDWQSDPWVLTKREGRYYGRGTCDMKGFVATVLSRVTATDLSGLKRPIQIALSRDEEIGCLGAPAMIERMKGVMPPATAAIIGEPTMMQLVNAHKSGSVFRVTIRGHEVHSSVLHRGVSAVMVAGRLIDWIHQANEEQASRRPTDARTRFDPPYTTMHVGRINGGTAHNITAGHCSFDIDLRCVPDENADAVLSRFMQAVERVEAEMKAIAAETSIEVMCRCKVPALQPESAGAAEELVRKITARNAVHAVSYITEAGQFQAGYCSSVVCGPGDIAQAHGADEFVAEEQLKQCETFVDGVIAHLSE